MEPSSRQRKVWVAVLGVSLLVLFLGLAAQNAFNLKILSASSTATIVVFTALSALAFLLFVMVLVLLVRNVLKLYAEQSSRVLGSRLRTRMFVGAMMLSFAPILFMFLFSYQLMNRAVDRWFSQPVTELRDDSNRMALELSRYGAANARAEAESLATSLQASGALDEEGDAALQRQMANHQITLQGGFAVVYRDGKQVAAYNLPSGSGQNIAVREWLDAQADREAESSADGSEEPKRGAQQKRSGEPMETAILHASQRTDEPILSIDKTDYALGTAWVKQGGAVVVALPMPYGMSATVDRLRSAADTYWTLYRSRRQVRSTYMLLLLMITSLTFFSSSWLALYLSKQVTRPVEALADAMDEIAGGHYAHRVAASATQELGELVRSFNHMAADLESSRAQAETSTLQLSAANAALEARRRELETLLETIPNGVVTLDANRRIVHANRAFSELMDPGGQQPFIGLPLRMVFPADATEVLERLVQRSHRMGIANSEFEMRSLAAQNVAPREARSSQAGSSPWESAHYAPPQGEPPVSIEQSNSQSHSQSNSQGNGQSNGQGHGPGHGQGDSQRNGQRNLVATVALLERMGQGRKFLSGYVLVLEDVTELLRAQKQVAWREVARRVAHEIKNPLTPISLSADRIARHLGRLPAEARQSESAMVIQKCSQTIASSVESIRVLVDQFAALAEFPTARPRPADVNSIVETALALFAERLHNIRIVRDMAQDLPLVMADPEALKRALANLVDNAAEAMQHSLLRELHVSTCLLENNMVELVVADTGMGLTDDMRERLFLPYFTTKQRGTGLGLAIAAKIIQEHQGSIRAEKNYPAGARFLIELPVVSVPSDEPGGLETAQIGRQADGEGA